MAKKCNLDLRLTTACFRKDVIAAWNSNDLDGVLLHVDNHNKLRFVFDNMSELKEKGMYEKAFFIAFSAHNENNRSIPFPILRNMFLFADSAKLRALSDFTPPSDPVTIYRGVAGDEPSRRVQGFSWTSNIETAAWFAIRYVKERKLKESEVYEITVPHKDIWFCTDQRLEWECVLVPPLPVKPKIVRSWRQYYDPDRSNKRSMVI